jgi:hypothetical protein
MLFICAQFKPLCENIVLGDIKADTFKVVYIDHNTNKKIKCTTWDICVPTICLEDTDGYRRQRKPMQLTPFFVGKEYITCRNCACFNSTNIRRRRK